MALLDPRNDSFITLLIEVSGRARPSDLNAVSTDTAGTLLQEYAAAHPEKGLVYDGQVLTYGADPAAEIQYVVPADAPSPVSDATAQPFDTQLVGESSLEPDVPIAYDAAPSAQETATYGGGLPAWVATQPDMDPVALPSNANTELPAWVFEGAPTMPVEVAVPAQDASLDASPAHEAVFTASPIGSSPPPDETSTAGYGVPIPPGAGGYYGVQDAAPPEYLSAPVEAPLTAEDIDYAGQGQSATMDYIMTSPSGPEPVATRVNGLWWLAVLFFGAPGAFVAWFVNRKRSGSRTFLWVGIALIVLSVLLVGAAIMLLRMAAGPTPVPGAIPTPAP